MAANKSTAKEDRPATAADVIEDVTIAAFAEAIPPEPEIKPIVKESVPIKKPAEEEPGGFCVYIGPTVQGVIQSGTVYGGTRESVKALLAPAIEKYPLIERLIVTDRTFAEDRIKVKTAGNQLYVLYKKLASGRTV